MLKFLEISVFRDVVWYRLTFHRKILLLFSCPGLVSKVLDKYYVRVTSFPLMGTCIGGSEPLVSATR
jgi:hypothetical protein